MKITFLGTGTSQGIPVIACKCSVCLSADARDARLRSSVMIETGGKVLVIDAGPDFRMQMLREQVEQLDAVLITHAHKDHTGGLDDVRSFNFCQERPMDVFATAAVHKAIEQEFLYAFESEKYPGVPQITQRVIGAEPFVAAGITVVPLKALHYKMEVTGYRIGRFAYLTDVSFIDDEEKKKLAVLDVLVLNALRVEPHYSHYNLEQALQLITELRPKQAFLTHISHLMGLYSDMEQTLPPNVSLAYDGLKFAVSDH